MNCCSNCFSDQGLKSRLEALTTTSGDCDFCETGGVNVVSCEELSSSFDQLFELYANHRDAKRSSGLDRPMILHEHLRLYWRNLFNHDLLKDKDIKQLVNQIGRGSSLYTTELFESPIEYEFLIATGAMPAADLQLKWDNFAKEIKEKNRFF